MPKAISGPSTPTETVSAAPPPPTRRATLAAILTGATAVPIGALVAHAGQTESAADPVVALYGKWLAAHTMCHEAGKRHAAMRADFIRRYGDVPGGGSSVRRAWKTDPQHAEMMCLRDEADRWNDEATDLLEILVDTRATSAEGILCKVKILAKTWTFIEYPNYPEPQFHEEMTLAFMRDAERLLGARRAV